MTVAVASRSVAATRAISAGRLAAGLFALAFGAFVVFGAGFAQTVHDAAHDGRHAFAFPCH